MNIGKCKNQSKYVCDKCGEEIIGYHKNSRRHRKPNKYYKADKSGCPKKDFDLCEMCENKFRKWLKEREMPTPQELIDNFPR
jgi:predicted RNA-binding Zn-ribbon protein involved in translation (DUF1610 family)